MSVKALPLLATLVVLFTLLWNNSIPHSVGGKKKKELFSNLKTGPVCESVSVKKMIYTRKFDFTVTLS